MLELRFSDRRRLQRCGCNRREPGAVAAAFADADVVATVRPFDPDRASIAERFHAVALSFLQPNNDTETIAAIAGAGATALSFDLVPRIRARTVDGCPDVIRPSLPATERHFVGAENLPEVLPCCS